MISIHYYRKCHCVTVEGHAMSNAVGHDLVCAAVTILVLTLADLVDSMKAETTEIHVAKGSAWIFALDNQKEERLANGFDDICRGFRLLAERFPKNVSFEQK